MTERDYEALHRKRDEARRMVLPGPYRHYKNQHVYYPEKISIDKESEEVYVIYHDESDPNTTFHVTVDKWTEKIEYEGETVQRYTWLAGEIGGTAVRDQSEV